MKKLLLSASAVLSILFVTAQIKQGRVIYERTTKMQGTIKIVGMEDNPAVTKALSQPKIDRFELVFGNDKSLWQKADDELPADEMAGGGGIRFMVAGNDDLTYVDFKSGKKTEQIDIGGNKFIVEDSIKPLHWKLADETKTILNHLCRKATAETIGTKARTQMSNGEIKRQEYTDTTTTTAWFASDIPVFAGPLYPKQLPGLILELNVNNGRVVYTAIEIAKKADVAKIKLPVKGKKVTIEELKTEKENLLKQMINNRGIRVSAGG